MIKYVAISLIAIFLMACTGNKNSYFSEEEKEDSNAKEMLQGIWLDDETESPLMRVEGDTIYYADAQSTPIAFKIIRDTLYTYGNDTTYYKIDKQAEHIFWFHSITDILKCSVKDIMKVELLLCSVNQTIMENKTVLRTFH